MASFARDKLFELVNSSGQVELVNRDAKEMDALGVCFESASQDSFSSQKDGCCCGSRPHHKPKGINACKLRKQHEAHTEITHREINQEDRSSLRIAAFYEECDEGILKRPSVGDRKARGHHRHTQYEHRRQQR